MDNVDQTRRRFLAVIIPLLVIKVVLFALLLIHNAARRRRGCNGDEEVLFDNLRCPRCRKRHPRWVSVRRIAAAKQMLEVKKGT